MALSARARASAPGSPWARCSEATRGTRVARNGQSGLTVVEKKACDLTLSAFARAGFWESGPVREHVFRARLLPPRFSSYRWCFPSRWGARARDGARLPHFDRQCTLFSHLSVTDPKQETRGVAARHRGTETRSCVCARLFSDDGRSVTRWGVLRHCLTIARAAAKLSRTTIVMVICTANHSVELEPYPLSRSSPEQPGQRDELHAGR